MPEQSGTFDLEGARKSGFDDDSILSHLLKTRKFDVEGARKAGYSTADIVNHLAKSPSEVSEPAQVSAPVQASGKAPTSPTTIPLPPGLPPNSPYATPPQKQPVPPTPGLNAPEPSKFTPEGDPRATLGKGLVRTLSPSNLKEAALQATADVGGGLAQTILPPVHPEDTWHGVPKERIQGVARAAEGAQTLATPLAVAGGLGFLARPTAAAAAELAATYLAPVAVEKTGEALGVDPDVTRAGAAISGLLPTAAIGKRVYGDIKGTVTRGAPKAPVGALAPTGGTGPVPPTVPPVPPEPNPNSRPQAPVVSGSPVPRTGLAPQLQRHMSENLRALDTVPELQTMARAAAPEVARTRAKLEISQSLPVINRNMEALGLPPEAFPAALLDARLEAIEKQRMKSGRDWDAKSLNDIHETPQEILDHADFMDRQYGWGLKDKLAEIQASDLDPEPMFRAWVEEQFTPTVHARNASGRFDPQSLWVDMHGNRLTTNSLRQKYDAAIHSAAPKMANQREGAMEYQNKQNRFANQPEIPIWPEQVRLLSERDAARALRMKDLAAKMNYGTGYEIGNRRAGKFQDEFGIDLDTLAASPQFQQALSEYKRPGGIEDLLRQSHASKEGESTPDLGRFDTYYPMMPEDVNARKTMTRTERYRNVMREYNPTQFATGLLKQYSRNVDDLRSALGSAIHQGRYVDFVKKITSDFPNVLRELPQGEQMPEGWRTVFVSPGVTKQTTLQSGKVIPETVGRKVWIAPYEVAKELAPLMDRSPYTDPTNLPAGHIDRIMGTLVGHAITANLLGPVDNMQYLAKIAMVPASQMQSLGHDVGGYTPGILGLAHQFFKTGRDIWNVDPQRPEVVNVIRQMIDAGALHNRYMRETMNPQFAKDMGSATGYAKEGLVRVPGTNRMLQNPLRRLDALLYGPSGLDIRTRYLLWDNFSRAYPESSPAERARFVNEIATYNDTLTSEIERGLGNHPIGQALAPFVRTSYGSMAFGLRTATGYHALPESVSNAERANSLFRTQLSSGMLGYVTTWAMANYALNGKWPWDDPEGAKLGVLKLPPDLARILAPVVGDSQGRPLYTDFLKTMYRASDKGMALMGVRGAMNEAMEQSRGTKPPGLFNLPMMVKDSLVANDGRTTRLFMNGILKDVLNTAAQPLTAGPVPSGGFALMGHAPYMTNLGPPNGINFLNTRGKPTSALGELAGAGVRGLTGMFGWEGAAESIPGIGSQIGSDARKPTDKSQMNPVGRAVNFATPYVFPGLLPYPGNPVGRMKYNTRDTKRVTREYIKNQNQ